MSDPEMASFGPGPPPVNKTTFGGQAGVLALKILGVAGLRLRPAACGLSSDVFKETTALAGTKIYHLRI